MSGSDASGNTVSDGLLGAKQVRDIAESLFLRPTKQRGQNFVIDPNTVRRIVDRSAISVNDIVLEVGPGLGSLTLGLLPRAGQVVAIEIEQVLADQLPRTVAKQQPDSIDRLIVITADAGAVTSLPSPPTALVANLPYNVAVPVLLNLLARFPSIEQGLILVQAEVADRLAAAPGSRIYGVPSAKLAWYAKAQRAGRVPASVFWPVPRVESGLVAFSRQPAPDTAASREQTFEVIDAAFAQRRKTLRAALATWAGSPAQAEQILLAAGVDPSVRGEQLTVSGFAQIAAAGMRV